MSGLWKEIEERFAFRRAFRFGSVSTADFKEAFDMNLKTAERRLMECLAPARMDLKNLLCKEGRLLRPSPATLPPDFASEADLACALRNLQGGVCDKLFFALTGLREAEIGARRSAPKTPLAVPGILTAFVKAIRAHAVVEVSCAVPAESSIEGQNPSERSAGEEARQAVLRVVPASVQFAGGQLQLTALVVSEHDPETHQWIAREALSVFPLSAFSFAAPCLDARFRPVIHKQAFPALEQPEPENARAARLDDLGQKRSRTAQEDLFKDRRSAPPVMAVKAAGALPPAELVLPALYGRADDSRPGGSRAGAPFVFGQDAPEKIIRPHSVWR